MLAATGLRSKMHITKQWLYEHNASPTNIALFIQYGPREKEMTRDDLSRLYRQKFNIYWLAAHLPLSSEAKKEYERRTADALAIYEMAIAESKEIFDLKMSPFKMTHGVPISSYQFDQYEQGAAPIKAEYALVERPAAQECEQARAEICIDAILATLARDEMGTFPQDNVLITE